MVRVPAIPTLLGALRLWQRAATAAARAYAASRSTMQQRQVTGEEAVP
jgi:hypothetical protein